MKYLSKKFKSSLFQRFQSVWLGSIVTEPVVRQSIIVEGHIGGDLLTSWWPGNGE
jgi:hypothetical protein